jgi:hypothetical protein
MVKERQKTTKDMKSRSFWNWITYCFELQTSLRFRCSNEVGLPHDRNYSD